MTNKDIWRIAIVDGKPLSAEIAFKVPNENAWIIGAKDDGQLKMVKIQVTGANTYKWIRTKYRGDVCTTRDCDYSPHLEYVSSCIYKSFNMSCFNDGVDHKNEIEVLLVAKKGQSVSASLW